MVMQEMIEPRAWLIGVAYLVHQAARAHAQLDDDSLLRAMILLCVLYVEVEHLLHLWIFLQQCYDVVVHY